MPLSWDTPTMAELFARQGHHGRALAIYRLILKSRPDDLNIQERVAELEQRVDEERNAKGLGPSGERMSFRDHMKKIVDDVPGTVACTLMGFDGIAIDSYELGAEVDVQTLMTEYSSIAHQIRRALEGQPATGDFNELVLHGSQLTAVVRPLSNEYFLAALMKPEALSGKARYLMRVTAPKILQELAG